MHESAPNADPWAPESAVTAGRAGPRSGWDARAEVPIERAGWPFLVCGAVQYQQVAVPSGTGTREKGREARWRTNGASRESLEGSRRSRSSSWSIRGSSWNRTPPSNQAVTIVFWVSFLALLVVLFEMRKEPGGETIEIEGPAFTRFLFGNSRAGLFWLPIRLFLGFSWLEAGYHKFADGGWIDGGAVAAGLLGARRGDPRDTGAPRSPTTGIAPSSRRCIDNGAESWMGWVITFGEMAVGIGLIIGLLTGFAAFFGAAHEHVVPAGRLCLHEPRPVHPGHRPDAGLEGRGLLRRRPLSPAVARHAVASRTRSRPAVDRRHADSSQSDKPDRRRRREDAAERTAPGRSRGCLRVRTRPRDGPPRAPPGSARRRSRIGRADLRNPRVSRSRRAMSARRLAIERFDGIAFGERDVGCVLGVARAAGGDARLEQAPARPRRRTPAPRRPRGSRAARGRRSGRRPRARRPESLDGGRDARAVARSRRGRGHDRRARRTGATTRGASVSRSHVDASGSDDRRRPTPGVGAASRLSRAPSRPPSGSHQPRSRATCSSRGTTSRRTTPDRLERARLGDGLRGVQLQAGVRRRPRTSRGAAPGRSGRPRSPSARATRSASASGTSRCAPASQTRLQVRGTTRYAS